MNQKQTAWYIESLLNAYGVSEHHSYPCGCYGYYYGKSKVVYFCSELHREAYRLKQNGGAVPRFCPCGKCQELSKRTAYFHHIRDYERVDALRQERWEHFQTCKEVGP